MFPRCRAHPIKFRAFLELKFRHVIMIPQTPNFRWTEPCKLSMIKSIKILHGVQSLWENLKRAYHGGLPPASPSWCSGLSIFALDLLRRIVLGRLWIAGPACANHNWHIQQVGTATETLRECRTGGGGGEWEGGGADRLWWHSATLRVKTGPPLQCSDRETQGNFIRVKIA